MPRSERVFQLFVSSPSDLGAERDAVLEVVAEANKALGRHGLRLSPLRWEDDTYPAMGSDPQAILSEQLGCDYDVFLGMLWARFGTPTPRAASGTLEEFQQALARHKRDPESVRIMSYFKEAPPSSLDEIDLEQLREVRSFRDSLSEIALYGRFSTLEEFRSQLRVDLQRVLLDWPPQDVAKPNGSSGGQDTPQRENIDDGGDDDPGLLDVLESWETAIDSVNTFARRTSERLEGLNTHTNKAAASLNEIDATKRPKDAKSVINTLGDRLELFGTELGGDLPVFRKAFGNAMLAMETAASLTPDFGEEAVAPWRENLEQLNGLKETLAGTAQAMGEMRDTIGKLPRVTTRFNRAKRAAVDAIERLTHDLSHAVDVATKVEAMIQGVVAGDAG